MNLNIINLKKIVRKSKSEHSIIINDAGIPLFDPTTNRPAPNEDEPAFSEDICTIDENGANGVAFFAFDENRWIFYIDTLIDYNTEGAGIKWKWYYPPINSEDIEW